VTFAVEDVEAGYDGVPVLHGVSLHVEPGEVVALLGANGAGKSTLLRAATAMVPVTGGRVMVGGRDLAGRRGARRRGAAVEDAALAGVAHVPEGRRLFAGLSVRDNLRVGAWRTRARHPDLGPVLDLFPALAGRLDQVAGSLSGGEQQMCAIGRALMGAPAYLLIDELSLGLAPVVVDEIMARLPAITEAGTGVLLVEQDAGAALDVAARAYVLENGRVTVSGPADRLRTDPRLREAYLGL
jgi:branched-chain amino acid transport system ATP-binding protein